MMPLPLKGEEVLISNRSIHPAFQSLVNVHLLKSIKLSPFEAQVVPTNIILDRVTTHILFFRSKEPFVHSSCQETFLKSGLEGRLLIKIVNLTDSEKFFPKSSTTLGELVLYTILGEEFIDPLYSKLP